MNFVQLAIPFFILALLIEFAYGFLVKRQTYRLGDTINSLQLGVLSRLVGILRLGFSAWEADLEASSEQPVIINITVKIFIEKS